jgi:UDP-glucose 4-epimerase
MAAAAPARRVIAVTGATTFLGGELLRHLDEDPSIGRILALGPRPPALAPTGKIEHITVDLTRPTVDGQLADLLARNAVHTVVHAAFLSHPTHAVDWAHELEDVGTMHVLNACARAQPRRLVAVSSTLVYGAHPRNPNYIAEDTELRASRAPHPTRFVVDKLRADLQTQRFAREHPETATCILRFAPVLGPSVSNLMTALLSRPAAPVMMGHDPLLQFVHELDAAWALAVAVDAAATGAFNIVGKGVLPYTTVLALLGRVPVPVPQLLARPLAAALWATQLASAPPGLLDYLLYTCVADGSRARRELGFSPRFSIKRTLLDFLGIAPEDGATDVARAQA